jgi:hypothetical protein
MRPGGNPHHWSEAQLDPWCVVPLDIGEPVLFGFALSHPVTGGLGWTVTSELLELNRAGNGAKTMSGRRYRLGRRFDPLDVGAEGEEARLAFHLLIGVDYEDLDELVEVDRRWLQAMKAARHLGVEPPIRTDAATRAFFNRHQAAYFALRQRFGRPAS